MKKIYVLKVTSANLDYADWFTIGLCGFENKGVVFNILDSLNNFILKYIGNVECFHDTEQVFLKHKREFYAIFDGYVPRHKVRNLFRDLVEFSQYHGLTIKPFSVEMIKMV